MSALVVWATSACFFASGLLLGWTAARARIVKRKPDAPDYFDTTGMPYAGIIEAEPLPAEDRVRWAQV